MYEIRNRNSVVKINELGAEYVCIEPWFGHDDLVNATGNLCKKQGILTLKQNC